MSNRMFYPGSKSLNRETITLYSQVTTTTNGTIGSQRNRGFSVAKSGTGAYTCTLENPYAVLLDADVRVVGTNTAAKGMDPVITASNVPNKTLTITMVSAPGTAAEVPDGAILLFTLVLSRVPIT